MKQLMFNGIEINIQRCVLPVSKQPYYWLSVDLTKYGFKDLPKKFPTRCLYAPAMKSRRTFKQALKYLKTFVSMVILDYHAQIHY